MAGVIQVPARGGDRIMAGKSPVRASEEQGAALQALASSHERGEADRASRAPQAEVVALATPEYTDLPTALMARTR